MSGTSRSLPPRLCNPGRWGDPEKAYPMVGRDRFETYLETVAGVPRQGMPADTEPALPPRRLSDAAARELLPAGSRGWVGGSDEDRIAHAQGKSTPDFIRARRGDFRRAPDLVVYPAEEADVAYALAAASRRGWAVIPFGGGSSVVGGVTPAPAADVAGVVSMDLTFMEGDVRLDEESGRAVVPAGFLGPNVESSLGAQGWTLGHFPQSFEYSTLGGWIATRGAGQMSCGYGKIEEMTAGVRLAAPSGDVLEVGGPPASATGPDLLHVVVGSEGRMGVITSATMRVCRLPETRQFRGMFFHRFEEGLAVARRLLRSGPAPTLLRLSDRPETKALLRLRPAARTPLQRIKERAAGTFLALRGFARGVLMLFGFEGERAQALENMTAAMRVMAEGGGLDLGTRVGDAWYNTRYELPYLRDVLMDRGYLTDTFETATTWAKLVPTWRSVRAAVEVACAREGAAGRGAVYTHLSHAYPDGASLYFTWVCSAEPGRQMQQWRRIKGAANDAIRDAGATASHHHGLGLDHRRPAAAELGAGGVALMEAIFERADPRGIMNPGKVIRSRAGKDGRT